jgi:aminoglycoside phosphotransferase family enzyme
MKTDVLQKALMNPAIYPDHPEEIGFTETHISMVFLTGRHVYKVKKPVNFGFLDFTTLEKREHFCQLEISLNRRLSRNIYLDVVAITQTGGEIGLDGGGRPVEYAVKMNQISEDRLMDRLLDRGLVTPEMVTAVADRLADFYRTAERSERIKRFALPERVREDTDENFEQTRAYVGRTISREQFDEIQGATNGFFSRERERFLERCEEERIRDCHGDLRLEHVFFGDEISILDCIEFNERFRYTDVAADIGFLAMDLDFRGREDLGDHLIEGYADLAGDRGVYSVLDFYKCYRAYVRGKVESFRLDDPLMDRVEKEKAASRARGYFQLAHRYAGRL